MRQIVLDTETTGLEHSEGHRIIEIGAVEIIDRRITGEQYHSYLNPERDIDAGALEVHGLARDFLSDKPRFADIAEAFLGFTRGAELLIHNAPFDVGFLNAEFKLLDLGMVEDVATVLDTLELARNLHPGMKNSLDALCRRYEVDNTGRKLHGALLDAELLAEVYLAMTGGQTSLSFRPKSSRRQGAAARDTEESLPEVIVIEAGEEELKAHHRRLERIREASGR